MAFDVEGARKAGYTDADINQFLGKQVGFDVEGARKAGYDDADILQQLMKGQSQAHAKPTARVAGEDEGDLMRGLANIPGQMQNVFGAGKVLTGLVANKLGAKETGKSLIQSGIESMDAGEAKQVVKESDDFLKAWEKGIGTVVTDRLPYQIGSGAGNIAETLAFMGIGAVGANAPGAIASVVGKSMVKAGIREAAEKIAKEEGKEAATKFISDQAKRTLMGATAGRVAQAGFHGAGEPTARAVEEAEKRGEKIEDIDLARLLPSVAAHAVADFFVNKIGLDAMKIGEKPLENLALEIGKRIAITGTKELPAEEIQTIAERYGAKLSLTDADAVRDYVNTAASSYGMSVFPGGVGGVRSHAAGQREQALKKALDEAKKTGQTTTDTTGTVTPPVNEDFQYDKDTTAALDQVLNRKTATTEAESEDVSDLEKKPVNTEWEDKAAKLIAEVDAGKEPKPAYLGLLLSKLGIEKPKGKGFKEKAVAAIKDHLAGKQQPDTTEPIADTDRGSAEVAASTSAEQPAAEVATGAKPSGMVSDGATTTAAPTGKGQQPPALTPETKQPATTKVQIPVDQAAYDKARNPAAGMMPIQTNKGNYAIPLSVFKGIDMNTPLPLFGGQSLATVIKRGGIGINEAVALLEGKDQALRDISAQDLAKYPELFGQKPAAPAAAPALKKFDALVQKYQDQGFAPEDAKHEANIEAYESLTPEAQVKVDNERNKVIDLINEGATAVRIGNAIRSLNKLEDALGLSRTQSGMLSARKPDAEGYMSYPIIPNTPIKAQPVVKKSEQEKAAELEAAQAKRMAAATEQEKAEADAEIAALKESYRTAKESGYATKSKNRFKNLPEGSKEGYEEMAAEVNKQAKEKEAVYEQLKEEHEKRDKEHVALVKELERLEKELEKATEAKDEQRVLELLDEIDNVEAKENAALEAFLDAEDKLSENYFGQTHMPTWNDLSAVGKDVYFENIIDNTKNEHRAAAKALVAYLDKVGRQSREGSRPSEKYNAKVQRVVRAYEQNLDAANERLANEGVFVELPAWDRLSQKAKDTFLKLSTRRKKDETTGKVETVYSISGIQQDLAFEEVAKIIMQEEVNAQRDADIAYIDQQIKEREKMLKEMEENQKELDRIKEEMRKEQQQNREKDGNAIPDNVIQMIRNDNLQGVLQYLRSLPERNNKYNKLFKLVANAVFGMKLNTHIELVESLPDDDLAIYDPATDTIKVTPAGLTNSTVLHEVIHAGTIQMLHHFVSGNYRKLTPKQLKAAQQLQMIMDVAKEYIGDDFPDTHFANLYEFVSYALTDSHFQEAIEDLSVTQNIVEKFEEAHTEYGQGDAEKMKSILPAEQSLWSAFKLSVAELLGIDKLYFNKKGQYSKNAPRNFLMEVYASFEDLLSVPTEPIYLPTLPTAATTNKQAPGIKPITLDSKKDGFEESVEEEKPAKLNYIAKLFTTVPGLRRLATMFANNRYAVKAWEATHEMAKQIHHVGKDKMNNIYTQLTLAASQARNLFIQYVAVHDEELNAAIGEFARLTGDNTEEALIKLHKILEALHEPERRFMLYMLSVPLRENKKAGETMSPADVRVTISKLLDTKKLKEKEIKDLRNALEELVFTKDANGEFVLDAKGDRVPNMANVDPLGSSPRITSEKLAKVKARQPNLDMLNINSSMYQVSVLSPNDNFNSAKDIVAEYKNHEHKEAIDRVIKSIQELHKATTELNKMANYWSQPVDNRVKFYGFENYIPMKGYSHNKKEEMLSFDTMRRGKELQELDYAYDGRSTVGKNPILQTQSDATRAALRAGRRDLTLAIRNAIKQGLIDGKVHDPITFEQRQNPDVLKALPRENTVFHYNEDGSIEVLQIYNKEMRESIRRTYEQSKPVVELANKITSGVGAMHTRYNYSFAPMNFVRDALTNAFAIGADMGPVEAANFIKAITGQVVGGNGLYKAMRVAALYQSTDKKDQMALKQMAKDDPYIQQMMEYVEKGGMVSYLQGLALKSNFQALHKEIGRSGILKTKEQLDKFVDIWTDMFELASRSAAYGVVKNNELSKLQQQVKDGKMTKQEAEETATIKATAFVKNLANFEQVGSLGRSMGAFYMFFRPAATGAVRAIEAIAPMWPGSYERAIANLPPTVTNNPEALAEFKKSYAEKQAHARVMTAGLIGMGSMAYLMAMMMSDDDELGRNAVLNDNMQQWTRFARFHIPRSVTESMGIKEPVIIQLPWGFGMGAFAAAGAQITGAVVGKTSVKEALANVFLQISLDSFVPLPISKMPPTDMPLEFFLDSIAPSVARPILEFALNKNGLGQDIYNDQNRRFGDAYTGGDKIPEIYKDAARAMANGTLGEIDISPNTLYFLANSYADGASRIFEAGYGITDLAQGRKGFNPKTDLPLFGSFFGAKSNVDSREFSAVEKKIEAIESKVKMFESNPEIKAEYLAAHPFDEILVSMYNKDINGELKNLRSQAKQVRLMQGFTPAERDALLKIITFQQNLVKHNLIEKYKAYGVEP
jgi:hypothetical protein